MGISSYGGSATNAGIEYQQRVSALFLITMLCKTRAILGSLGLRSDLEITSIAYETAEYVDDLKLACASGQSLYLQIKRHLSLSSLDQSDFYKTIDQFVQQHLSDPHDKIEYILATSPDTSGAIVKTLKKLTEAHRLNPAAIDINPLSKAEQHIFNVYKALVLNIYKKRSSREMTQADFVEFNRRVYIVVLDVESGGVHESVAITLLTSRVRVSPELVWSMLIQKSLHYAKNRLSITVEALLETLSVYLDKTKEGISQDALSLSEQWSLEAKGATRISSGKEVVLVESNEQSARLLAPKSSKKIDLFVLEFYRFDDNCSKRLKYFSSSVVWGKLQIESKVIFRSATMQGMARYLENNSEQFKGKSIAFVLAKEIDDVDETACARVQADLCKKLLDDRKDILKCLHCGKAASQYKATLVEIDDAETQASVGVVHDECLRPIDRVLGQMEVPAFDKKEFLKYFDIDKWIVLILKGQFLFNGLKKARGGIGSVQTIAWNAENEDLRSADYCVKIDLKNGLVRHATSRGKLDRYPKHIAELRAKQMNQSIAEARGKNNPLCYTSINWSFGNYSLMIAAKEEEEECVECISASVVRYSEHIGRQYPVDVQYYAPLLYLVDPVSESRYTINRHLVFITDPLGFGKLRDNWIEAGIEVGVYEMRIVDSDDKFDKMVAEALADHVGVVIDPILDKEGNLAKGYILVDIETISVR